MTLRLSDKVLLIADGSNWKSESLRWWITNRPITVFNSIYSPIKYQHKLEPDIQGEIIRISVNKDAHTFLMEKLSSSNPELLEVIEKRKKANLHLNAMKRKKGVLTPQYFGAPEP